MSRPKPTSAEKQVLTASIEHVACADPVAIPPARILCEVYAKLLALVF